MQGDNRPIGFFDSGVGGLTVLQAALKILPNESYVYIGDTEYLPYGTKSPTLVKKLSIEITKELLKHSVKAIVVACNTASAVALPEIQKAAGDTPVIGVIDPTVRYALSLSPPHGIAVIATETTIASDVYERTIQTLSKNSDHIVSKATPLLVPLIEAQPYDQLLIQEVLHTYLEEIRQNKEITTLILGCTHYPLIKQQIESYLGSRVTVIDSAHPTATVLKNVLVTRNILHTTSKPTKIFFTSDDPSNAMKIAKNFLGTAVELHSLKVQRER